VLQREPRQRLERLARVCAEVVVEAGLGAVARWWELEHSDLRAAPLELLAKGEDRLDKIGAGMTAEEIGKYVRNPKGVDPNSKMPSQKDNLSERELDEVASFLATLK